MKIMVTGSRGYVGKGIVQTLLEHGHQVVGFNRSLTEGHRDSEDFREVQGDIADIATLFPAMEECDAVIHSAIGSLRRQQNVKDYKPLSLPGRDSEIGNILFYRTAVYGSFNVFEAARQIGVQQVVNMSSAAVVFHHIIDQADGSVHEFKVDADTPVCANGFYGFTKDIQEQIAEFYAREYEMSVVTLRPWWVVDGPTSRNRYGVSLTEDTHPLSPAGLVCRYDLGEACHLALEHSDIQYDVFYPVAGPMSERYFDVEHIQRELGWQPRYTFQDLARG